MKNLVIVESPSKSKTIGKYLGQDYTVVSSKGHIRDLATRGKEGLGVDIENDFAPTYEVSKDKTDTVKDLKSKAKKAEHVFLATDPDREGEAISWHLAQELGLSEEDKNRVTFNEITKNAVTEAFDHPRPIDMDLVHSQETRRILDRIIGFKLSKLLKGLHRGCKAFVSSFMPDAARSVFRLQSAVIVAPLFGVGQELFCVGILHGFQFFFGERLLRIPSVHHVHLGIE